MVCQRVLMSSPWKHTVYINSTQRKGSTSKCPVQSGCGFRTHFNLISLSQLTSNCCSFTPLTDFDRARGHTSELQQQCKACGKIFDWTSGAAFRHLSCFKHLSCYISLWLEFSSVQYVGCVWKRECLKRVWGENKHLNLLVSLYFTSSESVMNFGGIEWF